MKELKKEKRFVNHMKMGRINILKEFIFTLFGIFIFLFLVVNISALNNESINAGELIEKAGVCLDEMTEREIPILRANDSYQEALQLYSAQSALEGKGKNADYGLVLDYASDVCELKEIAIEAYDELRVFKETFEEAQERINLSVMFSPSDNSSEGKYEEILRSFSEERFEDTIELIDEGYSTLSETEASQTTLRLFYSTTTKTIKSFFIENWKKLSIGLVIVLILILIFWTAIGKLKIRLKIRSLTFQKQTLNSLIKKLQFGYFKTKKVSGSEFEIKLGKYKEMVRDIDRQIPLLKEDMLKLEKGKKGFRKFLSKKGKEGKVSRKSLGMKKKKA